MIAVPIIATFLLAAFLLKPHFRGSAYYRGEMLEEVIGRMVVGVVCVPMIWILYFLFLN